VNHAQARSLLGDYMEGDLATAEHTALDDHLGGCASCRQELRDLRSVVGLVRALPDPQAPVDLAEAVMVRIHAGEGASRMRMILGGLRRVSEPRFVAALAAGVAGLLAWSMLPALNSFLRDPSAAPQVDSTSIELAARPAPTFTAGGPSEPKRRPRVQSRSPAVPIFAGVEMPRRGAAFQGGVAMTSPMIEVDEMDRQLERIWTDPTSVLNRMGTTSPRGDLFARLAQRAARRGQAAELASRLISSPHPMANGLASRFLAASLAEDVQRRESGAFPSLR
jgi:hypothetical protein